MYEMVANFNYDFIRGILQCELEVDRTLLERTQKYVR